MKDLGFTLLIPCLRQLTLVLYLSSYDPQSGSTNKFLKVFMDPPLFSHMTTEMTYW